MSKAIAPGHAAVWTDDCQGKKDFDADLVSVSTRYWPGYATVFDSAHPGRGLHEIPAGGPSAHSAILVRVEDEETILLADAEFSGTTEAEVKAEVEAWVDTQFARVLKALRAEFRQEST